MSQQCRQAPWWEEWHPGPVFECIRFAQSGFLGRNFRSDGAIAVRISAKQLRTVYLETVPQHSRILGINYHT